MGGCAILDNIVARAVCRHHRRMYVCTMLRRPAERSQHCYGGATAAAGALPGEASRSSHGEPCTTLALNYRSVFSDEGVQAAGAPRSGADGPRFYHRELYLCVRICGPKVRGLTLRASRAGPPQHTGLARGLVSGVGSIKPLHADVGVVPERKHEHHATVKSRTHLLEGPLARKVIDIPKFTLLLAAEIIRD